MWTSQLKRGRAFRLGWLGCLLCTACGVSGPFEFEASVGTLSADMSVSVDGQPVSTNAMLVVNRTFSDFDAATSSSGVHVHVEQNTQVRLDITLVPGASCAAAAGGTAWKSERVAVGIDAPQTTICHTCFDTDDSRVLTCN